MSRCYFVTSKPLKGELSLRPTAARWEEVIATSWVDGPLLCMRHRKGWDQALASSCWFLDAESEGSSQLVSSLVLALLEHGKATVPVNQSTSIHSGMLLEICYNLEANGSMWGWFQFQRRGQITRRQRRHVQRFGRWRCWRRNGAQGSWWWWSTSCTRPYSQRNLVWRLLSNSFRIEAVNASELCCTFCFTFSLSVYETYWNIVKLAKTSKSTEVATEPSANRDANKK